MHVDTTCFSFLEMNCECVPLKIPDLNCVFSAAEARAHSACLDPVFPHKPRPYAGGR
jgi:hypothetical protein